MSPTFAAALAAVVLAAQPVPAEEPTPALLHLANRLTGSFANAAQATADPESRDMRSHVARILPAPATAAALE